jgi:hypothetical protein
VQHAFTWRLDKTRTYLAKDSKKSDPQDEKDPIPGGNKDGASLNDEGNEVESACGCRQGANYNGIDLWWRWALAWFLSIISLQFFCAFVFGEDPLMELHGNTACFMHCSSITFLLLSCDAIGISLTHLELV